MTAYRITSKENAKKTLYAHESEEMVGILLPATGQAARQHAQLGKSHAKVI